MMEEKKHTAHVLPLRVYLTVGAILLFMTFVTVAVSFVPLGPFNLVVAMGIATFKAMLVGMFFMHLLYDNKLYATVFLAAVSFLAVFIVLTMFDTLRRGDLYDYTARPIKEQAAIYENMPADSSAAAAQQKH